MPGGGLVCVQNESASTELCVNGRDEDCDGQVDEADCECAPADTVATTLQTRRTSVKLSELAERDKLSTRGGFATPGAGLLRPSAEEVSIRIDDASGLIVESVLPPGSFIKSPSGRTFTFRDRDGTHLFSGA